MSYDKKTRKNLFLLLIIIFCILLLIVTTYRRAKTWRADIEKITSSSKSDLGFPEAIDYNSLLSQEQDQENVTQEEFVSQDEKLIVNYPSDWDEAQKSELENLNESILLEKAEFIFFARKVNIKNASVAFLMVQEVEREGKDLSEIIEESKTQAEIEGEVEIIDSKIYEEDAYLEISYKRERYLRLKEKFFLSDQKIYLITIISPEENWEGFRKDAERIIASARLIK